MASYRPAPGNFARWRSDHPDFDPFALPLVQAKSHVLAHAIGDLAVESREVLHTVAAFRAPVEYATLAALFVTRRGWSPRHLDDTLTDLDDRGLMGWDRTANTYDLHPIVRGVVWNGLEHFAAVPSPSTDRDEGPSLDEAHRAIELFTALVGLDRFQDAVNVYFDRLNKFRFHGHGMGNWERRGRRRSRYGEPPRTEPRPCTSSTPANGQSWKRRPATPTAH